MWVDLKIYQRIVFLPLLSALIVFGVVMIINNRAMVVPDMKTVDKHMNTTIYEYKGCLLHAVERDDGLCEVVVTRGKDLVVSLQTKEMKKTLDFSSIIVDSLPEVEKDRE